MRALSVGPRDFVARDFVAARGAFMLGLALLSVVTGCAQAPSPLTPHWRGSIGLPHRGVLTHAAELPGRGPGFRVLARNNRHFGTPRFVAAIERAAAKVEHERPGAVLTVGDISLRTGGKASSHASHRSGRDADLLLYVTTLEGVPTEASGFVHVASDGLAWDEGDKRFLRFDVARQWLLVKALVEDPDARIQWLFVSRPVEALLLEWARARGESGETLVRAMEMLLQPSPPAQSHDDHIHVRTSCDPTEEELGCEPSGPTWPWLARGRSERQTDTLELVRAIATPRSQDEPALAGDPVDVPHVNR